MSNRIRLTARLAMNKERIAESQEDGLFPGDVGNEERKKNYRKIDEYHTFKQTVNHELPDMRHDWQDNPRDEVGMGIPKTAKKTIVTATANATKLAYFLLGKKASDEMIADQARDFLRLGSDRLEAAVARFAETVDLYEDEDDLDEIEDEDFEDDYEGEGDDEEVTASDCEEVMAEEDEVVAEEVAAEDEEVAPEAEEVVEDEVMAEEDEVLAEEEPVSEISDEDVQVAPESVEADDETETEVEIEECEGEDCEDVDFDFGDNVEADDATPDELKSVFEDTEDDEEAVPTAPVTAKIKKIGNQPKIASALKADELAGLWDNDKNVF